MKVFQQSKINSNNSYIFKLYFELKKLSTIDVSQSTLKLLYSVPIDIFESAAHAYEAIESLNVLL